MKKNKHKLLFWALPIKTWEMLFLCLFILFSFFSKIHGQSIDVSTESEISIENNETDLETSQVFSTAILDKGVIYASKDVIITGINNITITTPKISRKVVKLDPLKKNTITKHLKIKTKIYKTFPSKLYLGFATHNKNSFMNYADYCNSAVITYHTQYGLFYKILFRLHHPIDHNLVHKRSYLNLADNKKGKVYFSRPPPIQVV